MQRKPEFRWESDIGMAVCILSDGVNEFIGMANCDPDDYDMMSEKTGCQIALYRAEIKYYLHMRDNEIKPAIAALKQTYYSMNRSKYFNEKSYENKMLWRQIRQKENDLALVKDLLTEKKQELKEFLEDKDKFYKQIRKHRAADSVGQN